MGPEGTFSERAAELCYSESVSIHYYDDIADVVEGVVGREVDQGIIPVENSLAGSLGITLDLLRENDIRIIGEVLVPIRHCLLAKGDISNIRIILSHPQALAQCRRFIKERFDRIEVRTTGSTAHAAKLAGEFGEMAALAPEESASKYNLKVLIRDVHDYEENTTRFIVLGTEKTRPTGDDKTSILIYPTKNEPGTLHEILGTFAIRNINLTKIESRPSKKVLGDYVFYIDCEGHEDNPNVKEALLEIGSKVYLLKVLGSYPKCRRS